MSGIIRHMPGTVLTPDVVLARTMQKPGIKGVVVIIQWDDGQWDIDWSSFKASEFAMAAMVLDAQVRRTIFIND